MPPTPRRNAATAKSIDAAETQTASSTVHVNSAPAQSTPDSRVAGEKNKNAKGTPTTKEQTPSKGTPHGMSKKASSDPKSGTHGKNPEPADNRPTVVFFHPDLGIGGAERLVVDAAVGLQQKGRRVVIFTQYCDPGHCFEEARDGR
jgi:hypothetical protein